MRGNKLMFILPSALFFAVLFPVTIFAADVTPHNITNAATPLYFDTGKPEAYTFAVFSPDGKKEITTERGANNGHTWDELMGVYDEGTYHALLQNNLYDPCLQLTYIQCLADPSYLGVDISLSVNIGNSAPVASPQIQPVVVSASSIIPEVLPTENATTSYAGTLNAIIRPNFIHDLALGSVGDDVKALQAWLNTHGYSVAQSGAGSLGNETNYFGERTRAALVRFQKTEGIMPTVGYFGPKTRGIINAR